MASAMMKEEISPGPSKDNGGTSQEGESHSLPKKVTMEDLDIIIERAMNGSETASRIIETHHKCLEIITLLQGKDEFSEAEKRQVLDLLYDYELLEPQLMGATAIVLRTQKIQNIVAQLFEEKCEQIGEKDMKIVSYNLVGSFTAHSDMSGLEILKEGVRRYPTNPEYYVVLACCFNKKDRYKDALFWAEEGLKLFPGHLDLLYARSVYLNNCKAEHSKILEAIMKFLNAAPPDHRLVPDAYYQTSYRYILLYHRSVNPQKATLHLDQAKFWFKRGVEAVKDQLPVYLPYQKYETQGTKKFVKNYIAELEEIPPKSHLPQKGNIGESSKSAGSIFDRKPFLKSPTRKGLILKHRRQRKVNLGSIKCPPGSMAVPLPLSTAPKLTQKVANKMSQVTPITLLEMNLAEDHIFENRMLQLTIVDEPNSFHVFISLVAEDGNRDVTRLYIYNVNKDKAALEKFQTGCRIGIVNPYMRIGAATTSNGIRVDEPRCIVYLEKVEKICGFCGEANAAKSCSLCKRSYCSKECQSLDWKELKHKLMCRPK